MMMYFQLTTITIFAVLLMAKVDLNRGQIQGFLNLGTIGNMANNFLAESNQFLNASGKLENSLDTKYVPLDPKNSFGRSFRNSLNFSFTIANFWRSLIHQFNFLRPLDSAFQTIQESVQVTALCNACRLGLTVLLDEVRTSSSPKEIIRNFKFACSILPLNFDLCQGVIREYGDSLYYILKYKRGLTADRLCAMYMQDFGCETKDPQVNWDVFTTMGYDSQRFLRDDVPTPAQQKSTGSDESYPTLKILQLADIHLDPQYMPGSETNCRKEICCRGSKISKYGRNESEGAGYFGDYRNCDLPVHTFEMALAHIAETHPDIDMIYMTGDYVVRTGYAWNSSQEEVLGVIAYSSDTILKYFPTTPVIPALGNHDAHPLSMFAPTEGVPERFNMRWLYEPLMQSWSQWLPEDASDTFLKGGFYSKVVNPKLKIIVLNTNVCYSLNLWAALDDVDPQGQLQWLVRELLKAEESNQNVHILGHVPPNHHGCWQVWATNFYNIVNRFRSTIKAQFYGHTHKDEFGVYYDQAKNHNPINAYFVGVGLTPWLNLNPGYKIYAADGAHDNGDSAYEILDHETWIFNLTDANLTPLAPPEWFKLYSAKEEFRLKNLSPSELHSFVQRMSRNETDFHHFNRISFKATPNQGDCERSCRKASLCAMVTPSYKEYSRCVLTDDPDPSVLLPQITFNGRNSKLYRNFPGPPFKDPWAGLKTTGVGIRRFFQRGPQL